MSFRIVSVFKSITKLLHIYEVECLIVFKLIGFKESLTVVQNQ